MSEAWDKVAKHTHLVLSNQEKSLQVDGAALLEHKLETIELKPGDLVLFHGAVVHRPPKPADVPRDGPLRCWRRHLLLTLKPPSS